MEGRTPCASEARKRQLGVRRTSLEMIPHKDRLPQRVVEFQATLPIIVYCDAEGNEFNIGLVARPGKNGTRVATGYRGSDKIRSLPRSSQDDRLSSASDVRLEHSMQARLRCEPLDKEQRRMTSARTHPTAQSLGALALHRRSQSRSVDGRTPCTSEAWTADVESARLFLEMILHRDRLPRRVVEFQDSPPNIVYSDAEAFHCAVTGNCHDAAVRDVSARFHLAAAGLGIGLWVEWVNTRAQLADAPSRIHEWKTHGSLTGVLEASTRPLSPT
jgi:hypothetical protein